MGQHWTNLEINLDITWNKTGLTEREMGLLKKETKPTQGKLRFIQIALKCAFQMICELPEMILRSLQVENHWFKLT